MEEYSFESAFQQILHPKKYHIILFTVIFYYDIIVGYQYGFAIFGGIKTSKICINESFINNDTILSVSASNNEIGEEKWFDHTNRSSSRSECSNDIIFHSIIITFNLNEYEQDYVPELIASVQLIGAALGTCLGGITSDAVGRRTVILLSVLLQIAFGIGSAFANSWRILCFLRFIVGIFQGANENVSYTYTLEHFSSTYRLTVELLLVVGVIFGLFIYSFLAWIIADWIWLVVFTSIFSLPGIPLLLWLKESPRWLLQKPNYDKAEKALLTIAKINKVELKDFVPNMNLFRNQHGDSTSSKKKSFQDYSLVKLFKSKTSVKYIMLLMYVFFVTGLLYIGLPYSMNNLSGNPFLNLAAVSGACVATISIIALVAKFKDLRRKILHQVCLNGMWISALVSCIIYGMHEDVKLSGIALTAGMIGFPLSVVSWVLCNIYTIELFPTEYRNASSGLCMMVGNIGDLLAPQFLSLIRIWRGLPFLIFTAVTALSAVFAFIWLPETLGEDLPDTSRRAC